MLCRRTFRCGRRNGVKSSGDSRSLRDLLNQQPKFVRLAQKVVIPLSSVLLSLIGAWWFVRGNRDAAMGAFGLAVCGLVSIPLYYALYLGGVSVARRRAVRESIDLTVHRSTAFGWVTEALRSIVPDADLEIDAEHYGVAVDLPARWNGRERVTAVVHSDQSGGPASMVEITSHCVGPQIIDYGRNRANVEKVINTLKLYERKA